MKKTSFTHSGKIAELAAGRYQSDELYGKRQALGDYTFAGQPSANDKITVNGMDWTFVASGAVGAQINIGADLTTTITNAMTALNGSADARVSKATYSNVGGTKLHVVFDAYGTAGNSFSLAETSANISVSGATLTGGVDASNFDLGAETKALVTVAGSTVSEFDLPAGEEGQETTVYLKTKGAGSNAQVNGTFAGGTKITFDTAGKFAKLKWLNSSWAVIANTGTLA